MKAKKVRQLIMQTVRDGEGVTIYQIMAAQWKADSKTTRRRIVRSVQKLIRWGRIRLDSTKKPEPLFFVQTQKVNDGQV